MSLYEVANVYLKDLEMLEHMETSGELSVQALEDTLEGLPGEFEEKAKNVAYYAKNLEAEADAIKSAIEAMQARSKALQNKADWMRWYLESNMLRTGITEIKCPYFVMKIKKNPPKVVVDCEAALPDVCFKVIPETRQIDKAAIKELLLKGDTKTMSGAHIEQGERLEIK